jgi:hypothetical protein
MYIASQFFHSWRIALITEINGAERRHQSTVMYQIGTFGHIE